MDASIFIAKVLGLYLIVLSIGMFINHKKMKTTVKEFDNPGLIFLTGILALITGCLIIAGHNVWVAKWPVVITILGWLAFVKGIIRLWFPKFSHKMNSKCVKNKTACMITILITLIIGLFLSYYGFIA